MRISIGLSLPVLLLLSACATTYSMDELTSEEKTYLKKVAAASVSFEVEKPKSDEIWSRGNSFIVKNAGMKIQSANEYMVSTADPDVDGGTIGYLLTKELKGNQVKFTIKCMNHFLHVKYTPEVCRNNERLMSHYLQTGELMEKFVDAKVSTGSEKGFIPGQGD